MDAPPTQYRVIERGRKLIVLDTATNLPPKQACDINPGGHELQSATAQGDLQTEILSVRPDLVTDQAVADRDQKADPQSEESNTAGIIGFALVIIFAAILWGGLAGFVFAVVAMLFAGQMIFNNRRKQTRQR